MQRPAAAWIARTKSIGSRVGGTLSGRSIRNALRAANCWPGETLRGDGWRGMEFSLAGTTPALRISRLMRTAAAHAVMWATKQKGRPKAAKTRCYAALHDWNDVVVWRDGHGRRLAGLDLLARLLRVEVVQPRDAAAGVGRRVRCHIFGGQNDGL